MKKVIATKNAPAAIGPYSQAVQVGNMLFASGQLGLDPATGNFAEGGVKEQTVQAFKNVHAILEEAGLSINDVVKTTVFLADMSDFAAMNDMLLSSKGLSRPVLPLQSRLCRRTVWWRLK